jgi:hypothetical protein
MRTNQRQLLPEDSPQANLTLAGIALKAPLRGSMSEMAIYRQLPFPDRYNVSVCRKKLWGTILRYERHTKSVRVVVRANLAVRVGARLNQDWQSRRDPLPAVNHPAHVYVPFIEQQIRMFLAFISSGHHGERPSCQHFTIDGDPVYHHVPVRRPAEEPEPAGEMKVKNRSCEQACRDTDQSKPSHKLFRHLNWRQCSMEDA